MITNLNINNITVEAYIDLLKELQAKAKNKLDINRTEAMTLTSQLANARAEETKFQTYKDNYEGTDEKAVAVLLSNAESSDLNTTIADAAKATLEANIVLLRYTSVIAQQAEELNTEIANLEKFISDEYRKNLSGRRPGPGGP